jgi:tRNA(Ile)-lysidine synthase
MAHHRSIPRASGNLCRLLHLIVHLRWELNLSDQSHQVGLRPYHYQACSRPSLSTARKNAYFCTENYTALYHTRKCAKKSGSRSKVVSLWYNPPVKGYPEGSQLTLSSTPLPALLSANLERHCSLALNASTAVVAAVSGGADSLALLHALYELHTERGFALHVAHFDHGLRPESTTEAASVAEAANALQLPFHLHTCAPGELSARSGNLEQNARLARYAFLCTVAQSTTPNDQTPLLMTAHHAFDQAETVLLHVVRGTGITGLSGIRWSTCLSQAGIVEQNARPVRLVRPLLNIDPALLRKYLLARGITWQDDPSNLDTGLTRNRLRHEILPALAELNPQITVALGRLATIAAGEAVRLEALDLALLESLIIEVDATRCVLALAELRALSRADQRGAVRAAMRQLLGETREIHYAPLEELLDALPSHGHAGGPHSLAAGLCWSVVASANASELQLSLHRTGKPPVLPRGPQLASGAPAQPLAPPDCVHVADWTLRCRRLTRNELPADWRTASQPWRAFLDAERVSPAGLRLVPAAGLAPGTRFAPLGLSGQHKQVGDLFTDSKTPPAHRPGWPVIIDGGSQKVLWLCGVRAGHAARLTPATQHVIELHWIHEANVASCNAIR